MLVKLTRSIHFNNILRAAFSYESISLLRVWVSTLLANRHLVKCWWLTVQKISVRMKLFLFWFVFGYGPMGCINAFKRERKLESRDVTHLLDCQGNTSDVTHRLKTVREIHVTSHFALILSGKYMWRHTSP